VTIIVTKVWCFSSSIQRITTKGRPVRRRIVTTELVPQARRHQYEINILLPVVYYNTVNKSELQQGIYQSEANLPTDRSISS